MRFEWDDGKDEANQRKHGLAFLEARELLESDTNYMILYDEEHSLDEERFITIGPISRGVISVVWTEPVEDVVRIISARFADQEERELFREFMEQGHE